MHNIDRTLLELDPEGDFEGDFEQDELLGLDRESVFNEEEEMALAAELLSVSDEQELDQFLGGLLKKAGRALGGALRGGPGRMLGGLLRGLAKRVLPMAGGALGSLALPGIGTSLGANAGQSLGKLFGLELEGLSLEDQEFEVARSFVKLAGEAAKNAATTPVADPLTAARNAIQQAASTHAPGIAGMLARGRPAGGMAYGVARKPCNCGAKQGKWIRQGNRIILIGM
jgi:hypothetical protein